MKSELEKKLQETHEGIIAYNMHQTSLEGIGELIASDLMSFGTTSDEVIHNLDAYVDLLKKQWQQISNESLSMKVDRNEVFRRYSPTHETAIIAEIVTLTVTSDSEEYTLDLRLSRLFELINGKWKLVHSHTSTPSSTEKDSLHLNEWKAEKERLDKLISEQTADLKRQNEELKIEAALDRVRAVAVNMTKPADMLNVCRIISDQLQQFGVEHIRNIQTVIIEDDKHHFQNYQYFTAYDKELIEKGVSDENPSVYRMIQSILESPDAFFTGVLEGEEFEAFKQYRNEQDSIHDPLLYSAKSPNYHFFSIGPGALGITLYNKLSDEGLELFRRFHSVFSLSYRRFRDIEKVEAQAREAKIEVALERVRSSAMAMQKGEELATVISVVFQQLVDLGFEAEACGLNLYDDHEGMTMWISGFGDDIYPESFHINYFDHPYYLNQLQSWKNAENYGVLIFEGELKRQYDELTFSNPDFFDLPKDIIDAFLSKEKVISCAAYMKYGMLEIIGDEAISENQSDILCRFAKVFQQAYTRFLDLKKAEAQARQANIETGLERVRSKTMAMHRSSELESVIRQIFQEIRKLDIEALAADLLFFDDSPSNFTLWISGTNGTEGPFHLSNINHPHQDAAYQTWKNGDSLRLTTLKGDEFKSYFENLFNPVNGLHTINSETRDLVFKLGSINHTESFTKHGCIRVASKEALNDNQCAILTRFASAFDLAYRRFLDLQKAEKQAKETKIELSLERIRSRVTAMQESSELFDIVVTMRNEFISLGHQADYFWHMKWAAENYEMSMTAEDGSRLGMVITIPKFVHEQIESLYEWEESDDPYFVLALNGTEAWDYIDKMNTYGKYQQVDPHAPTEEDIHHLGGLTFIIVRTTHGEIGYSLPGFVPNPPAEGIEILTRFASAFDLAYRRFEDLLVAEQQAYEARIETSLERIRGLASAMNHSDDLKQIAEAMFSEMEILQINPLRYGLAMIQESSMQAELWASTVADGKFLDLLGTVSFDLHPMLTEGFEAWEKQYEEHIYTLKGEEIRTYYERISQINPNIKNLDTFLTPDSELVQYCSFFPFKTGILYAFTEVEPNKEGLATLKRFANVFEQAHIRYNDLQIAEEQAQLIIEERDRLEQTLKELRSTQEQLIQQEKLASLGQLTAGIAHEIKNPLNFVNNFSDLSIELVEETREELQKDPADTDEALEILNDIETNLKTIHKHGSRADSIVKSMLQHSRGGSGSMEAVALNPLIKEFVNLAFHGMRAGKDPINVDIELNLDDSITDIQLIAEDFSRVVLNICNNAFDAMREKATKVEKQQMETSYQPKLSIRTRTEDGKVHIEIEDNGPGIPESMKDKITQPFFTTKKGTDGTGLGLSITHDIIKAHGGVLEVHSTEMVHTIFKITL